MVTFHSATITFIKLLLLLPVVATAQTLPSVHAVGDSYTRQTPCIYDYRTCDALGLIHHERSYSSLLNGATRYQVVNVDNAGRGGDTCTTQAPYTTGPWTGQARGVLAQVDTRINNRAANFVSILLGINDANVYGVDELTIQWCLESLYVLVTNKKIVALTYPPISSTTAVWSIGGSAAEANRLWVNRAIRNAVASHNANYPTLFVRLVDLETAWASTDSATHTMDGAHPSPVGAVTMARKWFETVCGSPTFITGCAY